MDIVIRKAVKEDAAKLYILNELFNGQGSTTLEKLTDSIINNQQEIVFVAADDNEPVGFICGQVFKSMCYSTYYGEISELFIKEEYRRKGIAGRLINRIEEEFIRNNIYSFQLFTGAANKSAQAFYETKGYKKSEEWMYRKRV